VTPAAIQREAIDEIEILARVEGVEWWRRDVPRRDLAAAWLSGALAWLQIDDEPPALAVQSGTRRAGVELRGWVD
jgi:hypothetical protein